MQPLIHAALARARADEIARHAERKAAMPAPPRSRRARFVEDHAFTSPRVTEAPRSVRPATFDDSVW